MKDYSTSGSELVMTSVFVIDFVLANLLATALFMTVGRNSLIFEGTNLRTAIVVLNMSLIISEYFYHGIIHRRLLHFREVVLNVFRLTFTHTLIAFALMKFLFVKGGFYFMIEFFCLEFFVILLSRMVERSVLNVMRRHGRNLRRVLLVGNDKALAQLYEDMESNPDMGYKIIGYYANDYIAGAPESLKRLGDLSALNREMANSDRYPLKVSNVDEVFCSLSHDQGDEVARIMRSCDRNVIRFFYIPRVFTVEELHLRAMRMGDYLMYTNHDEPLSRPFNRFVKRLFDIVCSLLVCLFLVPITLVVGFIIKLQSPGPVFFKQQRTGINGNTFWCYKFRSMHVNKDSDDVQATENDPRKFPFGDFMRRANIDELPQFFNVLKGDMSIVGPRPHMLKHTEIYGKLIDKYMVRHFCKPGITGWAQVTGFRGETKELWQMEERVRRDVWYVEHWSFWLDLRIILMTAKSIFVHDEHAY